MRGVGRVVTLGLAAAGLVGCVDMAFPPLWQGTRVCSAAMKAGFLETADGAERPDLWIAFVDVGHGDSTWLRLPGVVGVDAPEIVVDAGDDGLPDAPHVPDGGRALLDLMRRAGLTPGARIAAAIVTHPDKDHYGGWPAVLGRHRVERVIYGGRPADRPTWRRLEAAVEANGARWQAAPETPAGIAPPVLFEHPEVDIRLIAGDPHAADDNGASLIVQIAFRGRRVLLMADAEGELEARVAARAEPVDILRTGHHGGVGTSGAALLDRLLTDDSHGIISAGERDGLPDPEVVARLSARLGERLWRTDRADAGRSRRDAAGDDHVIARIAADDGRVDVCHLDPDARSAADP